MYYYLPAGGWEQSGTADYEYDSAETYRARLVAIKAAEYIAQADAANVRRVEAAGEYEAARFALWRLDNPRGTWSDFATLIR